MLYPERMSLLAIDERTTIPGFILMLPNNQRCPAFVTQRQTPIPVSEHDLRACCLASGGRRAPPSADLNVDPFAWLKLEVQQQ
jgi:hypothetical protein